MQKIVKKADRKKNILSFAGVFSKFVKPTEKKLSYEEAKEKAVFLWIKDKYGKNIDRC